MQDTVLQDSARNATELDEPVLRSSMTAMVTIIMGRNDSTRARSEDFTMSWKGETVSGKFAAEQVLLESLSENADAWISYLRKADNRKVATSMDVALDDSLAGRLETLPDGVRVVEALRRVLDVAPVFEPEPTGEHRIIDLREEEAAKAK
jgi:hypothetical protein